MGVIDPFTGKEWMTGAEVQAALGPIAHRFARVVVDIAQHTVTVEDFVGELEPVMHAVGMTVPAESPGGLTLEEWWEELRELDP